MTPLNVATPQSASELSALQELIRRGLIVQQRLLELFSVIEDQLYKYPAIDGASFRRAIEHTVVSEPAQRE